MIPIKEQTLIKIGDAIAISATLISIIATAINNLLLDHNLAMVIWGLSNPLLLAWFIGNRYKKWNGGISIDMMIAMYIFYIITNTYGLWQTHLI